jgi:hypothetical protein
MCELEMIVVMGMIIIGVKGVRSYAGYTRHKLLVMG